MGRSNTPSINVQEVVKLAESHFMEVVEENGLELNWKKESSFAIQCIQDNSELQKCSTSSLVKAVYNVALTGLTLNPKLAYCYLIPRGGKAILDISYQGLIFLMTNTLNVNRIHANVVYANDEFDYFTNEKGTTLHHKPNVFNERGEVRGAFAIAYMNDKEVVAVVLSEAEINDIKGTSKSAGSKFSPWSTFPDEMRKKTAVRRLWKMLPKTQRVEQVGEAIQVDNDNFDAEFKHPQPQQKNKTSFTDLFGTAESVPAEVVQENEIVDADVVKVEDQNDNKIGYGFD